MLLSFYQITAPEIIYQYLHYSFFELSAASSIFLSDVWAMHGVIGRTKI